MTNTELLRQRIKSSGLKLEYIASKLGISRYALTMKIQNETEFKVSEVQKMCDVLAIDNIDERENIFFAMK